MIIKVDQKVPVYESYAAERTRGLYNVAPRDGSRFQITVNLPIEKDDWQVGAVVGPSGGGKSSILRKVCAKTDFEEWQEGLWPKDQPIVEVLGSDNYARATASLAAVGLGSVPSWLRPYHVLSTGEKFRAECAKVLLSSTTAVVIDEFTSVLDRQVAQIGAGAFVKAWRRKKGRKLILFSCHTDILPWVLPDWWLDVAAGQDTFAEDRPMLQPNQGEDFDKVEDRSKYRGKKLGEVTV